MVKAQKIPKLTGRLWLVVYVHPRDRREIDIDNRVKALQDALQHAGVYENDSQIDDLHVKRGLIVQGGRMVVTIGEIADVQK